MRVSYCPNWKNLTLKTMKELSSLSWAGLSSEMAASSTSILGTQSKELDTSHGTLIFGNTPGRILAGQVPWDPQPSR